MARKHPEVLYAYSTVGSSDGSGTVDTGTIYLELEPKKERDITQQQLAAKIRDEIRSIAGATAYLARHRPGRRRQGSRKCRSAAKNWTR